MKTPINPITIYGNGNFTIGRLWIGSNSIPDASYRFNPKAPRQKRWDKPVTMLLWHDEKELLTPEKVAAIIVDEEDFVASLKLLKTDGIELKVWGRPTQTSEEKIFILFSRVAGQDEMKVSVVRSDVAATVKVSYSKLVDGLGHLFPNGELENEKNPLV